MPTRRDGLHAFAAALASAGLAGCGFELRRAPALPFRRMALVGFSDKTTTADELRRALPDGVAIVEDPRESDVVLEALADRRRRSVAASTAAGQVREVTLHSTLTYRLSTRGGKPLLPPATIELRSDMSYSETLALGKADEEQTLWRAMEADIAMQVLRRLAATPPL